MVFVKICGITNSDDARAAVEAGANALGFNFWRPGKRYIAPERAAEIIAGLPGDVWKVGVFVDEPPENVRRIAADAGLTALQMHGSESPEYLDGFGTYRKVKAFRIDASFSAPMLARYHADAFLLDGAGDTPGGTGATFDWKRAVEAKSFGQILLAGGLTPENVAGAVRSVRPWGVDAASGVESAPGKKDPKRVRQFIEAVREVEHE